MKNSKLAWLFVALGVAVLIVMGLILATVTKPVQKPVNPYCQFKAPYKTKVLPTGRACE